MKITNHRLEGDQVSFVQSESLGGPFGESMPDSIILHYTAGPSTKAGVNMLTQKKWKVSAHLVIGTEGEIVQCVGFDTIAWHAGKSAYNGRKWYNRYSIGIEIVNPGPLTKQGEIYKSWWGKTFSADQVLHAVHRNETEPRYWGTFTEEQIAAVMQAVETICDTYDIKEILGHEEIAPGRKQDPGPAFPLDKLRKQIFERNRNEGEEEEEDEQEVTMATVAASGLNVRSEPNVSGKLVALPLSNGTQVEPLEEQNGWCKVKLETYGWVKKEYLNY